MRAIHLLAAERDLADCVEVLELGEREERVAELRLRGRTRSQIANDLGIHLGTVHTHIRRIARVVGDECLLTLVNTVFRRVRERDRKEVARLLDGQADASSGAHRVSRINDMQSHDV